jgi:hypothetical protein
MKAEEYSEWRIELAGWPVIVASYRLGSQWHAKADDVSPGATLARAVGATREAAEADAVQRAEALLARTRRYPV